jgi:hypothetical protein
VLQVSSGAREGDGPDERNILPADKSRKQSEKEEQNRMKEHTISVLMKVEKDGGGHFLFDNIQDFIGKGGTVAVYAAASRRDEQPYEFTLTQRESSAQDGYHLIEAKGQRTDPPAFFPWLIIDAKFGRLSYHLPMRPDVSDGPVFYR